MSVRHFTSKDAKYPHWMDAHAKSAHAHLLDAYHPV
jgi:hypothetical protein